MGERKEHAISVSVPEIIGKALQPVEKNDPSIYVSAKLWEQGKVNLALENLSLTSENHAIYIGKYLPLTPGEKMRRFLGWGKVPERIYNEEMILGALDYAFAHVQKGQKVRVVVCRILSELFNGTEDVTQALPVEAEIKWIYKLAQKHFKKGKEHLEVVALEKDPLHEELFKRLEDMGDVRTNQMEMSEAMYSEDPIAYSPSMSSLELARALYQAQEESSNFRQALKRTVPERLQLFETESDEDASLTNYYGLIEIAIRLKEVLNGRFLHGGVDRQEKYDKILRKILYGKFQDSQAIKSIQSIALQGEKKTFGQMHLVSEKNIYRRQVDRNRARLRMAFYGACTVLATTGLVGFGQERGRRLEAQAQEETQRKEHERFREALGEIRLTEYGPTVVHSVDESMRQIGRLEEQMKAEFMIRYNIKTPLPREVEKLFREYLVKNKAELITIYGNWLSSPQKMGEFVDLFMRNHEYFFQSLGVETGRPYAHLLPHKELLEEALSPHEDVTINRESVGDLLVPVGKLLAPSLFKQGYQIYSYRGKLVACGGYDYGGGGCGEDVLSTEKAKKAAEEFHKIMVRTDILEFINDFSLFSELVDRNDIYYFQNDFEIEENEENKYKLKKLTERGSFYKDFYGEFEYELRVYEDSKNRKKYLLARKNGGKNFSSTVAREAANHFMKAYWIYNPQFYRDYYDKKEN